MKKYRKIQEDTIVFQWLGDTSIISEINTILEPFNEKYVDTLKVGITEDSDIMFISHVVDGGTSSEFVRIGEYIVFDINNYEIPLACYNETWLNKHYKEI